MNSGFQLQPTFQTFKEMSVSEKQYYYRYFKLFSWCLESIRSFVAEWLSNFNRICGNWSCSEPFQSEGKELCLIFGNRNISYIIQNEEYCFLLRKFNEMCSLFEKIHKILNCNLWKTFKGSCSNDKDKILHVLHKKIFGLNVKGVL